MSLLFSSTTGHEIAVPVSPLSYRDVIGAEEPRISAPMASAEPTENDQEAQLNLSSEELEQLLAVAKAEATADAERRFQTELDAKLKEEADRVRRAIDLFTAQRRQYFARVEGEVIRLALAVAAKILQREAHADPMLIAAMVRIALDKLQESSSVSIRVPLLKVESWKEYMTGLPNRVTVEIIGDPQLDDQGCILQAKLGTVDFSIDAQLKEVEQGFYDLLAQRPVLQ